MLWCPRSWGQMWSEGGGTHARCPETCHHQHKSTDTPMPHTRAHSFQTHSEHRPRAPEPRSWSGRAHTQAPSWALGAAHCPPIAGLPSSRSVGAKEGSLPPIPPSIRVFSNESTLHEVAKVLEFQL